MRGEKLLRAKEELEERSNDRETMNSPKQQGGGGGGGGGGQGMSRRSR
jgi:hypothetical protein